RATGEAVAREAVQDRGLETGAACERGVRVQAVAVTREAVDQSLIAIGLVRDNVVGLALRCGPVILRTRLAAEAALAAHEDLAAGDDAHLAGLGVHAGTLAGDDRA